MIIVSVFRSNVTVPASSNLAVSANDLSYTIPTGYTPIGITQLQSSNGNLLTGWFNARATTTGTVVRFTNISSSDISVTVYVSVAFIKSDFA